MKAGRKIKYVFLVLSILIAGSGAYAGTQLILNNAQFKKTNLYITTGNDTSYSFYDGTSQIVPIYSFNEEDLAEGDFAEVTGTKNEIKNVGTYENQLIINIYHQEGDDKVDVTGNYNINYTYGNVVILPKRVVLEFRLVGEDGTDYQLATVENRGIANGETLAWSDSKKEVTKNSKKFNEYTVNLDDVYVYDAKYKITTSNYQISFEDKNYIDIAIVETNE